MLYELALIWISLSFFASGFDERGRSKSHGIGRLNKKLDRLVKVDLQVLLPVLHDILNFYLDSKNDIDLNVYYGIFLLNVIIKGVFKEKSDTLPTVISYSIKQLLEKNEELFAFFKVQVKHDADLDDKSVKKVLTLYVNESLWMSQIKKFDIMHRNKKAIKYKKNNESYYGNKAAYEERFKNSIPTPRQADYCLQILAKTPIGNTSVHKCEVPNPCANVVYKGSDIGFALTHRLLMLQLAHFGRRCTFISEKKDKKLERRLCKQAFQEATFLSNNGYIYVDLMFEQITFCALVGHFEFLKRSWLTQLARFRTKDGCFAAQLHHKERRKPKAQFTSKVPWLLNKDTYSHLLNGWCEAQVTSGALTTIVLAVKFILEAYY